MALLPVLRFPDPRLRNKAAIVEQVDGSIQKIVDDMLETMYEENGVGLAAIQVDIKKQIIVMDVSDNKDGPMVLINPQILSQEGKEMMSEGCLSVPDLYAEVERACTIEVKALSRDGKIIQFKADGLLAHCIQHEMDHLQGKLFIDYLSRLKRERYVQKLEKLRKQNL